MSNKTYAELQRELTQLQSEIAKVRNKEAKGVIKRMLEAIRVYSITPEELGFVGYRAAGAGPARNGSAVTLREAKRPGPKVRDDVKPATMYRSLRGKEWDGTGARPAWLVWALRNGHALEEFEAGPWPEGHKPGAGRKKVRANRPSRAVVHGPTPPKYRDPATGAEWNGKGRRPHWFLAALGAGKAANDLLIDRPRQAA